MPGSTTLVLLACVVPGFALRINSEAEDVKCKICNPNGKLEISKRVEATHHLGWVAGKKLTDAWEARVHGCKKFRVVGDSASCSFHEAAGNKSLSQDIADRFHQLIEEQVNAVVNGTRKCPEGHTGHCFSWKEYQGWAKQVAKLSKEDEERVRKAKEAAEMKRVWGEVQKAITRNELVQDFSCLQGYGSKLGGLDCGDTNCSWNGEMSLSAEPSGTVAWLGSTGPCERFSGKEAGAKAALRFCAAIYCREMGETEYNKPTEKCANMYWRQYCAWGAKGTNCKEPVCYYFRLENSQTCKFESWSESKVTIKMSGGECL